MVTVDLQMLRLCALTMPPPTYRLVQSIGGSLLTVSAKIAAAQSGYNLQPPQTSVARTIYALHMQVLWVCTAICVVVFAVMLYSIVWHRRSRGHAARQFSGNKPLEVAWAIAPVLIVIGIAVPATAALVKMRDTSDPDITVKITGYQWSWRYDYLNENIGFYSELSTPQDQIKNLAPKGEHYLLEVDRPLVVPVGKKVRILVTANDVIHSWWVPAFGVKQDGIPGFIRDSWFKVDTPGVYRGQCAELCGKDHGFMPVVVNAVSESDYHAWVDTQHAAMHAASNADAAAAARAYTMAELKEDGEKVYAQTCATCHQAHGEGLPGAFPALTGSKIATGPVAGTIDIVMNGSKHNPTMAAWKRQLSDLQLASVITYVRNSFGNEIGDVVEPKDISAARGMP